MHLTYPTARTICTILLSTIEELVRTGLVTVAATGYFDGGDDDDDEYRDASSEESGIDDVSSSTKISYFFLGRQLEDTPERTGKTPRLLPPPWMPPREEDSCLRAVQWCYGIAACVYLNFTAARISLNF